MSDIEKIHGITPDLTRENVDRLLALFPDVATEITDPKTGRTERAVDFDALRERLGDVAEGNRERYQFTWPGKREAKRLAREPIAKTLRPVKERSKDWDTTRNLYIEGDNLDALKLLRENYAGKVKLIYIDPPYNTGHDFVYDDDFSQTHDEFNAESGEYNEEGGRLVANPESNGRFHSDWCSMICPRLLLARDLLTQDGAIFISIDDNESKNLRAICDEIFGESNFVGDVIWQKTYSPRNDSKGIPTETEHILIYAKQDGWTPKRLKRTTEMDDRYASSDGDPRPWSSGDAAAPGAATHQGMVYAIQHPITGSMLYPPNGRHRPFGGQSMLEIMNEWAEYEFRDIHDEARRAEICGVSPEDVRKGVKALVLKNPCEATFKAAQERYDKGHWPRLYFTNKGKGGMRLKRYLDSMDGKMPTNLWPYSEVGHTDEAKKQLKTLFNDSAPFDTPKPTRLMKRMLDIASDKNSLVLDFFSGSATMGEAVIQKNADDKGQRKFILVQLPEETTGQYSTLTEIGEERIRRAGEKIKSEIEAENAQLTLDGTPKKVPDIGFRVLRVDDSNYEDRRKLVDEYSQKDIDDNVDITKMDRSDLDLLFEALPKFQLPYSSRIDVLSGGEFDGHTVYSVNDGQLLACFENSIPESLVRALAAFRPRPSYVLVSENGFLNSAARTNFAEIFKQAADSLSGVTQIRII